MKLRWLTQERRITAEEVKLYATENDLSLMQAKDRLLDRSPTILQYWDGHAEQWITVPFVTEYRK